MPSELMLYSLFGGAVGMLAGAVAGDLIVRLLTMTRRGEIGSVLTDVFAVLMSVAGGLLGFLIGVGYVFSRLPPMH